MSLWLLFAGNLVGRVIFGFLIFALFWSSFMLGFSFISSVSEFSFFEFFGEVITSDMFIRFLSFLFVLYLGCFFLDWSFFFDEFFC